MKKIKQIYDLLQNLPEKDIPIAVQLLDKRDFIGLKELVDSDVYIVNNAKFKLSPHYIDEEPTLEYLNMENKFNKLKDLQYEVDKQAEAFEPEVINNEDFLDLYD